MPAVERPLRRGGVSGELPVGGRGSLSSDVRAEGVRCPDELLDDLLREETPVTGELLLPPPSIPPVDVKSAVAGNGSENLVRVRRG